MGGFIVKMCEYGFNKNGISAMYSDCLDLIFTVLESENFDSLIDEININISIGDKKMVIPICADAFEKLFDYIKEAEREDQL